MEHINERIFEIREGVKAHLTEFLATFGILLNDLKVLIVPKDDRMRELISLQAIGLSPIEAVRYYLALKMAERGLVSAPNAAAGLPFNIGGQPTGFYPLGPETGLPQSGGGEAPPPVPPVVRFASDSPFPQAPDYDPNAGQPGEQS